MYFSSRKTLKGNNNRLNHFLEFGRVEANKTNILLNINNGADCLKHIPQKASYLVLEDRLTFLLIILLTLQLPSYGYNMVLFDT